MSLPLTMPLTIHHKSDTLTRQLTLPRNGLLTLIGPNASGKSHTLRAIQNFFVTTHNTKQPLLPSTKHVHYLGSNRLSELEHYHQDLFEK